MVKACIILANVKNTYYRYMNTNHLKLEGHKHLPYQTYNRQTEKYIPV